MPAPDPVLTKLQQHIPALLNAIAAAAARDGHARPIDRCRRLAKEMPGGASASNLARNWNRWMALQNVSDGKHLAQVVQAAQRCRWLQSSLSGGTQKVARHLLLRKLGEREARVREVIQELRGVAMKWFERKDLHADDVLYLLPTLLGNITQVLAFEAERACRLGDSAIVRMAGELAAAEVQREMGELADELENEEGGLDISSRLPLLDIPGTQEPLSNAEQAEALAQFEAEQDALAQRLNPRGLHTRLRRGLRLVR